MILNRYRMRLAANLNFLFCENGPSLLDKYKLAAKAGFKGVEISYPPIELHDSLVALQKECGLQTVLVNICLDGNDSVKFGATSIPGEEKQFEENFQKTVVLAKKLNCKKIHLMSGKNTDKPQEQHLTTYISNLKSASKILETEGITGVIEPINKYALPNYFMNSYKTAIQVLDEVNSKNLKLMVDVFHLQHIQGNVTNTFNELKHHVGHVQIAQAPHRHEPNVPGEIDYRYVFQAMKESGYDEWVGLEYKPQNDTIKGLSWIQEYNCSL